MEQRLSVITLGVAEPFREHLTPFVEAYQG